MSFEDGGSTKEFGMNVFKQLPKFIAKNQAKLEMFSGFYVKIQRIFISIFLIL